MSKKLRQKRKEIRQRAKERREERRTLRQQELLQADKARIDMEFLDSAILSYRETQSGKEKCLSIIKKYALLSNDDHKYPLAAAVLAWGDIPEEYKDLVDRAGKLCQHRNNGEPFVSEVQVSQAMIKWCITGDKAIIQDIKNAASGDGYIAEEALCILEYYSNLFSTEIDICPLVRAISGKDDGDRLVLVEVKDDCIEVVTDDGAGFDGIPAVFAGLPVWYRKPTSSDTQRRIEWAKQQEGAV